MHARAILAVATVMASSAAFAQKLTPEECTEALNSFSASAPSPPPEIMDYLSSYANSHDLTKPTDICQATADMPTSLSSAWSSLTSAGQAWYSTESSAILAYPTNCASQEDLEGTEIQISSALAGQYGIGCPSTAGTSTSTGSTSPSSTGTSATTGSTSPSSTGTSATTGSTSPSNTAQTGELRSTPTSSSVSRAAAPRDTGLVAGALAAAGFLGAVAML